MAKNKTGEAASKASPSPKESVKKEATKPTKEQHDLERKLARGFVELFGTGKLGSVKEKSYLVSDKIADTLVDKGFANYKSKK